MSENNEIMLFQQRQPPFFSVLYVVFTGSLLVGLKSRFAGDETKGEFQFISRLRPWLEFRVRFQHGTSDMIVQMC